MCYHLRADQNILTLQNLVISVSQLAEVKMGDKCLAPPNKWKLHRLVLSTPNLRPAHLNKSFKSRNSYTTSHKGTCLLINRLCFHGSSAG